MKKTTILLSLLALLLAVSSAIAALEYSNNLTFQSEISLRESANIDRDTLITQLDKALQLAESRLNLKLPNGSNYMTKPSDQNSEQSTKIFLNSTAAAYHYMPNMNFSTSLFNLTSSPTSSRGVIELTENRSIVLSRWGWLFDAEGLSEGMYEYGIWTGNPVLIIGATIRNDYTSADLGIAVGNRTGSYISSINLGVRLYSQNGSVIQASLIKNATSGSHMATGGVPFLLGTGQTKQVLFYISPTASDIETIDHYEIYVSEIAPY